MFIFIAFLNTIPENDATPARLLLLSLPIADTQGLHVLPQTADWSSFPPQQYLLTLGFKNKEDGKFLEKVSSRKLPTFTGDWNLNVLHFEMSPFLNWDKAGTVSQHQACRRAWIYKNVWSLLVFLIFFLGWLKIHKMLISGENPPENTLDVIMQCLPSPS